MARTATRPASAQRRSRIIEAALACFGEHGYEAVSIETIRRAAGVSVGSLYHHFDGKPSIAAAVYGEAIRRYQAALVAVLARDPGAEAGIRALVEAHHHWVAANPDWARFMLTSGALADVRAEAGAHASANEQLLGALANWARPLMDSGRLAPADPAVFASLLFGPSYFHTRFTLRLAPNVATPDRTRQFADAAWRATRGDSTSSTTQRRSRKGA